MFRQALASYDAVAAATAVAEPGVPGTPRVTVTPVTPVAAPRAAAAAAAPAPRGDGRTHISELATEAARIERLASIREVVFGAQDGLVSTFAVVAGLAAAGISSLVVLLGGAVSAMAGVLSMSIGTFLSSRAQRQLYETELARERTEISEHPGEEVAELIAALHARGMARPDAAEVARRIARHPDILLSTLSIFELGLAPQRLGRPVRDAFVMAVAFGAASLVPLVPFLFGGALPALSVAAALTLSALFAVGVLKARVAGVAPLRSGLEVALFAAASGLLSFGLGRLASILLGVQV
jgi:VIT1/CCC1 family predicted Fe2+/Mn2+ transporter